MTHAPTQVLPGNAQHTLTCKQNVAASASEVSPHVCAVCLPAGSSSADNVMTIEYEQPTGANPMMEMLMKVSKFVVHRLANKCMIDTSAAMLSNSQDIGFFWL